MNYNKFVTDHNAYDRRLLYSPNSLVNKLMPSTYKYHSSSVPQKSRTPIPTSLKMNSDFNLQAFKNKIYKNDIANERHQRSYNDYFVRNFTPAQFKKGDDMSFAKVLRPTGEVVRLNPYEAQFERQRNYFYKKQIEDNDYGRLSYIDYLKGRIEKVEPNPYNRHNDYLGESTLQYNTITNPTNNYSSNKYLFKSNGNIIVNQYNKFY